MIKFFCGLLTGHDYLVVKRLRYDGVKKECQLCKHTLWEIYG